MTSANTTSSKKPAIDSRTVETRVRRYLARHVDDVSLLDEWGLITGGLLDSLAAVALIAELERQFDIQIDDSDLDLENFDSIPAIVEFVTRKYDG
ncbi:acyl carrier protein [Streptomyces collinus]|uniref:acyl carrier protein n=1 Tax=Streptomyces collinus TaxID=42684 RepID=UPI0036B92642